MDPFRFPMGAGGGPVNPANPESHEWPVSWHIQGIQDI
jgi:hypothetical protein